MCCSQPLFHKTVNIQNKMIYLKWTEGGGVVWTTCLKSLSEGHAWTPGPLTTQLLWTRPLDWLSRMNHSLLVNHFWAHPSKKKAQFSAFFILPILVCIQSLSLNMHRINKHIRRPSKNGREAWGERPKGKTVELEFRNGKSVHVWLYIRS